MSENKRPGLGGHAEFSNRVLQSRQNRSTCQGATEHESPLGTLSERKAAEKESATISDRVKKSQRTAPPERGATESKNPWYPLNFYMRNAAPKMRICLAS